MRQPSFSYFSGYSRFDFLLLTARLKPRPKKRADAATHKGCS